MKSSYLFVFFNGEGPDGEQVYFAVSRDGLHWKDLNGGKPVLFSKAGEMGVRDPFIVRHVNGKFVIIGTDLRIASGKGWGTAQFGGSRNLIVFESEDLVHWSEGKLVEVGIPGAGCVWAPEAVYSGEKGQYLVFWASMVKEEGEKDAKQRIYASWTSDFYEYTAPVKFIERENHVIDTDIIKAADGYYYRFSKDETLKFIRLDRSKNLLEGPYEDVNCETLSGFPGVEGPQAYFLQDEGKWCLIVDRFATNGGYVPVICDDLAAGKLTVLPDEAFDMGKNKKRHGSVLNISGEEYDRLVAAFGVDE